MFMIRDLHGEPVTFYKRHRGVRRYAARHGGAIVAIQIDVKNGFWLTVLFTNTMIAKMKFSRYDYLKSFLLNWTAAQNKKLIHCGADSGVVGAKNPILINDHQKPKILKREKMSDPVFLPGIIKRETDSAWLLKINDPTGTLREVSDGEDVNNRTYWFPKSQCELHTDGLEVPDWLWKKKLEGD
jgi:hypothetical protein